MTAALELLKVAGRWLIGVLALLFDPRVWLIIAATASISFIRGCEDEKHRFDEYQDQVKAISAAQDAKRKQINERNKAAQKEVERDSAIDLADVTSQLDDANERLRNEARARLVPRGREGATGPVLTSACSNAGERDFLNRVYLGETVCYPSERLDEGIRGALEHARQRSAELAEPAITALDDTRWWGEWADKVGACKPDGKD